MFTGCGEVRFRWSRLSGRSEPNEAIGDGSVWPHFLSSDLSDGIGHCAKLGTVPFSTFCTFLGIRRLLGLLFCFQLFGGGVGGFLRNLVFLRLAVVDYSAIGDASDRKIAVEPIKNCGQFYLPAEL